MTKLGKRYIPVYGGTLASQSLYSEPHDLAYPDDYTIEVDLDNSLRVHPEPSPESLAMYWERVETHAAEQRAKYWPALTGGEVRETEPTRGMRVGNLLSVDEWGALNALGVCLAGNHVYRMIDATTATGQRNRSLLADAVAKLFAANGGYVRCEHCKTTPAPTALTPAEWSALESVGQICESMTPLAYSLGPDLRPSFLSAIAKLREQRGQR